MASSVKVPEVKCFVLCLFLNSSFSFQFDSSLTFACYVFAVKEHSRLKSRYKEHV